MFYLAKAPLAIPYQRLSPPARCQYECPQKKWNLSAANMDRPNSPKAKPIHDSCTMNPQIVAGIIRTISINDNMAVRRHENTKSEIIPTVIT